MKKILAVPVIIALLTAGSYGGFGYITKRNFDSAMTQISAQVPTDMEITYKQGFFSSTVEVKSKMPIVDPSVNLEVATTTNHTIYHGPFVFHSMQGDHPAYIPVKAYSEGTFVAELMGEVDAEVTQTVKALTTTAITSYVPLMGNATVQLSGEPVSKEFDIDSESLAFEWQGFTGTLELQGSLRDFTYEITAPGMSMAGEGAETFAVSTMTSSGTAHAGNFDIGLGDYNAGIQNINLVLSEEPGDTISITDMTINVIADEKDGLITFSEIFDIKSFALNNKVYGPANTTIRVRNLDAATLAELNHKYIEMQKTMGHDPEAMQAQLIEMATTHGITLLSKSPEIEFENVSLQTAEGLGELKLKISFNGEGEVVMNPFFLLGRLSADASFGADERFLAVLAKEITKEAMCDDETDPACDQQAASASSQQLQELLSNNQLILENGRYTSNISYKDGAAVLNGTPMPLF